MSMLQIQNRWVLVTGASSGLGRAAALHLAGSYRAKPLLVARRADNLLALQEEIRRKFAVSCAIIVADQTTPEGREKIAARVKGLDVVAAFLAAGITNVGAFDQSTAETNHAVIQTNIIGFTDLLSRIIAIFKQRSAPSMILAVSSLAGETSLPFQAVYSASKAYMSTLVRALSVELSGSRVTVGVFAPGGID